MLEPSSARPPVRTALLALILACVWAYAGMMANAGGARAALGYVPHEVIVGYAPGVTSGPAALRTGPDLEAQIIGRAAPAPSPHSQLLQLPPGESVTSAIARLRRQPGVAYAEPNFVAHAAGAFYPNDRGRSRTPQGWEKLQWNMLPGAGIDAPWAWANLLAVHRPGGRGVVVAVIDTGVAYRDWSQFHRSPDFVGTRFVHPYDFVSNNRYPLDRNGHGTFVAGVVAEATNNNFSLTGVAYGASVMPIRVLDSGGLGNEIAIARGIRYAVTHGASVINLSLEFLPSQVTSGRDIPEIVSAINFARRRGVTVVGASGNDETNQIAYPARVGGVISVGATTRDRCLAAYSNGGLGLDLVAPGGGSDAIRPGDPNCHPERTLPPIYQLTLVNPPHWGRFGYPDYYIGTSMSSPQVAGAAAMVIASGVIGRRPTPSQILARLEQTATPLGGSMPNSAYGYGLLNVGAATSPILPPAQR